MNRTSRLLWVGDQCLHSNNNRAGSSCPVKQYELLAFAGEHADSDLNDVQREVMTVLRRIGQPATARDVKRHSRMLQEIDKLDKDKIDGILEILWNLDKIERHFETGIGNRGTVRYKIKRFPVIIDVDARPVFHGNCDPNGNTNPPKSENSATGVVEGFAGWFYRGIR